MSAFNDQFASAARLQEVRRTARDIRGEHYAQDMVVFKQTVRTLATRDNLTNLEAAMKLGSAAERAGNTTDFMLFMAAFVELTEEAKQ